MSPFLLSVLEGSYAKYRVRIATLGYIMGLFITQSGCVSHKSLSSIHIYFTVAPIGNCEIIHNLTYMYAVALPTTLLLFVLRVSALYNHNKFVIAFFSLSWLCVFASAIAVAIGTIGGSVSFKLKTKYCTEVKSKRAMVLSMAIPLVHDTLIFLATSWAFIWYSYTGVSVKNGYKVMVSGKYLSTFSKSMLRDGQAYFL